ncbi:hypothetical protein SAMN02910327_00966 [Peptostreptococcaceae bacterium pGA-8]|nr:hypothetical protein SAMN02910327_00966 [Peptostreptococcaceae bacterium pGA-8]
MNKLFFVEILRWAAFPLGIIMFLGTGTSFGFFAGASLGILATLIFWNLTTREVNNIIGNEIAKDVNASISRIGDYANFVEIKVLNSGMVVRVYLVQAQEKLGQIKTAVEMALRENDHKDRILLMQLTNMDSKDNIKAYRAILNRELFEAIKGLKKMGKK